MAEVIKLSTIRNTKTVSGMDGKHRYTITYDPHAPLGKQWVWYIDYVQTYRYVGDEPTQERAVKAARRKILSLNKRAEEADGA